MEATTEHPDELRTNDLKLSEEPSAKALRAESLPPNLEWALADSELPSEKQFRTLAAAPDRSVPCADRPLPSLLKERSENADPIVT
jgi:hypothetical protein